MYTLTHTPSLRAGQRKIGVAVVGWMVHIHGCLQRRPHDTQTASPLVGSPQSDPTLSETERAPGRGDPDWSSGTEWRFVLRCRLTNCSKGHRCSLLHMLTLALLQATYILMHSLLSLKVAYMGILSALLQKWPCDFSLGPDAANNKTTPEKTNSGLLLVRASPCHSIRLS